MATTPLIRRIGIEGFRRLKDVDFEMRPMMAMIGANGVGKSSFMDALSLLAASARGSLNQHLNDLGGIAWVITRDGSDDITLRAELEPLDEAPLRYALRVANKFPTYHISQESLEQTVEGMPIPFKHIDSRQESVSFLDSKRYESFSSFVAYLDSKSQETQESLLSQVPLRPDNSSYCKITLSSVTKYHIMDVGQRAPVKLPQQLRPVESPGQNGEDLAPFLYNLRESNHDRFEAVEDALKVAFPGFESLGFPSVAAGMIAMTWKDKAFSAPFYMNQLSEGTLRFLWLVSLLQSPNLPTITMIDEPEVSLHPELLSLLADLMREASLRTQIVVATHSDRLVGFLKPKEVVVMDINEEDGAATMTWGDELDLEGWLKDYSLDELWQMGIMGGRA